MLVNWCKKYFATTGNNTLEEIIMSKILATDIFLLILAQTYYFKNNLKRNSDPIPTQAIILTLRK